jgi:hypothetical protein
MPSLHSGRSKACEPGGERFRTQNDGQAKSLLDLGDILIKPWSRERFGVEEPED